jgi:polysaccharide pyruvyl transferase WcaK-like protein
MIYHVYANRSNIGDWLSARGIQSQLGGAPVTELLCDDYFTEASLAALRGATAGDAVIIGGGGLFMDYFRPFWEGFEPISSRVPFVIWGTGLCDAKDRQTRPPEELLRRVVRRSRLCVVRDRLTVDALKDCGAEGPIVCPCLLALRRAETPGGAILHAVHYEMTGPEGYDALCALVRDHAASTGREYLETNNEIRADSEQSLAGQLQMYVRAAQVVSTRLHGCIIGLSVGRRVLALAGDRKVESFMTQVGLGDWICEPRDYATIRTKLATLQDQPSVEPVFERARHAQVEIGRRVRAIIDAAAGGGS